jgi:hypothetical protein
MPYPAEPAGPGPRQANPPGKEKGPGSAFGPESGPLATNAVSVVYWVPGPFPCPTPVQPDEPVGPANEPVAGLSSKIPAIAAMSTARLGLRRPPVATLMASGRDPKDLRAEP